MSRFISLALIAALCSACALSQVQRPLRSNALEFLYPEGCEARLPSDVRLQVPVRAGLAFAPAKHANAKFSETQRQALLQRVANSFVGRKVVGAVEVIPGAYLKPGGGFQNVDKLAMAFGIDLIVLISYDQFQVSETTRASWTYWTLVGAYVVKGETNETRTVLDAAVYDIPSRALLFHASGRDNAQGRSTPIDAGRVLRLESERGFDRALDDLVTGLDEALAQFGRQSARGTVRGAGTPRLEVVDKEGRPVKGGGTLDLAALFLAAAFALFARRRT